MILNIKHHLFTSSLNSKWVYYGTNYEKLQNFSKKFKNNFRISLTNENHLNFTKEKENYKNWLENQRLFYKDSLNWWMNNLATMSDPASFFLLKISQIRSIDDYLEKNKKLERFSIIAENFHMVKFLSENLKKKYKLKTPKFLVFLIFLEKIFLILKGFKNYLKIIYFFIIHYFFSLVTFQRKYSPKGKVYLFHDLINNHKFKDSCVQSRYFGKFPDWLKKGGKKVITLPWFYQNLSNKKKIYQSLREIDSFVPEDWLNIFNYIESLFLGIKSSFTINEKIKYPNFDVSNIIKYIKLSGLQNKSAIFFRYTMALKKWSKNIDTLIFIDHYQNQLYEHAIRHQIKSLQISNASIGYFHSLHSKNFLPYITDKKDWNNKVKPDQVICPNLMCKDYLAYEGVPTEKIKVVSDLQRESLFEKIKNKKQSNNNLLIILSLFPDSNFELLSKFFKINDYLQKDLGLTIKIRPHPYQNIDSLKTNLNWKSFPDNWKISKDDLYKDLNESYCVFTLHSSVVTDAIYFGCLVFNIKTELNVAENFLDFLETKFPLLKTIEENRIKKILNGVFVSEKNFYKNEFDSIKTFFEKNKTKISYENIIQK